MITAYEKFICARREVEQRRRVYARLVDAGTMTPVYAARQIELMEAIAEDYRIQAIAEKAKERLL